MYFPSSPRRCISAAMTCSQSVDPAEIIARLGKCSRSLDVAEHRELLCAAHIFQAQARRSVQGTLASQSSTFAIRSSSSDGTPLTVTDKIKCELPDSVSFTRGGKCCHEFLVGCSFYSRGGDSGQPATNKVIPYPPTPMLHGRGPSTNSRCFDPWRCH